MAFHSDMGLKAVPKSSGPSPGPLLDGGSEGGWLQAEVESVGASGEVYWSEQHVGWQSWQMPPGEQGNPQASGEPSWRGGYGAGHAASWGGAWHHWQQQLDGDPWAPPTWWRSQPPPPPPPPVGPAQRADETQEQQKRREALLREQAAKRERSERSAKVAERLEAGDITGAVEAVRAAWNADDELTGELLARVLTSAVSTGGKELANVLKALCGEEAAPPAGTARRLQLDIPSFSLMLQDITLGLEYRPHIVRMLLNLALPCGSRAVPLDPPPDDAFGKPPRQSQVGIVPENEDDEEDGGRDAPGELVLRGGSIRPDLEGSFKVTHDFDELLAFRRPVYERQRTAVSGSGGPATLVSERLFCYFWSFPVAKEPKPAAKKAKKAKKKRTAGAEEDGTPGASEGAATANAGWCLGSRIGASEASLLGFCRGDVPLPPAAGWTVRPGAATAGESAAELQPDVCGFVEPLFAEKEALQQLQLPAVMGCVRGLDDRTTGYFGHFCALLHMEYLSEVARLRHRLAHRKGEVLQRSGWALVGLGAREAKGKGKGKGGKGKGKGKGKAEGKDSGADAEVLLVLDLPAATNVERLRFKKGDDVMISRSDPLADKVGEGTVQELGDGVLSVLLRGCAVPEDLKTKAWRVDKGTNRLSYSRQLASLTALCSAPGGTKQQDGRPNVFELITAAAVGEVDLWAQRGTGIAGPPSGVSQPAPAPAPAISTVPVQDSAAGAPPPPAAAAEGAAGTAGGGAGDSPGLAAEPVKAGGQLEGAAMQPGAAAEESPKDAAPALGDAVRLQGLQKAELNGLEGVVTELPAGVGGAGRVGVRLQSGEVKAVRAENLLRLAPAAPATLGGGGGGTADDAGGTTAAAAPTPKAVPGGAGAGAADAAAGSAAAAAAASAAEDAVPAPAAEAPAAPLVAAATADAPLAPVAPAAAPSAAAAAAATTAEDGAANGPPAAEQLARQPPEPAVEETKLEDCRARLRADVELNPSQRGAVEATLSRRCTVIQGPPGTGKTTTAVHALHSWVSLGIRPLLATADGNIAVDNIAEGLAKRGVKVVRVGRPEKVQACLEELTLDAQLRARQERLKREEAEAAQRKRLDVLSKISVAELLERLRGVPTVAPSMAASARQDGEELAAGAEGAASGLQDGAAASLRAILDTAAERELAQEQETEVEQQALRNAERSDAERVAEQAARRRFAWRTEQQLRVKILQEADVVCTQMISAGGGVLAPLGPFQGMLIDEVGQATEITAIVPIVQRGCQRLVLAGDHCQLPPTVQSREAESRGLSVSLFSRLVGQGVTPFFLDTQFRSHPKLAEFSAEAIYDGKLRSGIDAEARQPLPGFQWPVRQVPVAFVESGREAREGAEGESRFNEHEVEKLLDILEAVLDAGGCAVRDAGVVTPYMAQVRLLRQKWRDRCSARAKAAKASQQSAGKKKRKDKDKADALPAAAPDANAAPQWWHTPRDLEIASVDHFQGREKELIVFSAVRNNGGGRVGFLSDWRRLNVMLTRARRGLIVVGNAWTLRHDSMWEKWLAWCGRHRVVVDQREWHRTLRRALKVSGTGKSAKELLKLLFALDQAPRKPKPFRALLQSLATSAELEASVEDLHQAWAAVASARTELEAEAEAAAEERRWRAEEAARAAEEATQPQKRRKRQKPSHAREEEEAEAPAAAAAVAGEEERKERQPSVGKKRRRAPAEQPAVEEAVEAAEAKGPSAAKAAKRARRRAESDAAGAEEAPAAGEEELGEAGAAKKKRRRKVSL